MSRLPRSLKVLKVTAPCPADWNAMIGNERVRYCGQCNLNVYNLSGMTSQEADHIVTQTEGRLCVRFYQRPDGTVLTQDCPVGLAAFRRRMKRAGQVVFASILGLFAGAGMFRNYLQNHKQSHTMGTVAVDPVRHVQGDVERPPVMGKIAQPQPMMGAVAVHAPQPKK
jgi:hypothetical protein